VRRLPSRLVVGPIREFALRGQLEHLRARNLWGPALEQVDCSPKFLNTETPIILVNRGSPAAVYL
jgi:hypothetical protein